LTPETPRKPRGAKRMAKKDQSKESGVVKEDLAKNPGTKERPVCVRGSSGAVRRNSKTRSRSR